ncbi:IS1595 family transposase [Henriciella barbarensis]|uniref:IS1595 family transposase n=1 Tax=Henriciella barbarensis TaxID=86342 RepID=A0A399QRY1_9PROT|nr:IS1595 family transposase [Henriciella barbarensis]RIJ21563.1 IS1595 family transposase [Henriciella barbarensis]
MSYLSSPHFHDEKAAYKFVEARVWADGRVCPHCGVVDNSGALKGKSTRIGVYKCYACRKPFTVKVGTIFEASKVKMHLWLQAIHLMASSKKGVSSNQLSRILGVTLKTAWFMSHRIREAMRSGALAPMGGGGKVVEADETYYGKVENPLKERTSGRKFKGSKGGRGPANKRAIVSLVERGGRVRSFHVPRADKVTVTKIVRENIDRESRLHTDGSRLYKGSDEHFATHETVDHAAGEYVRGDVHNNSAEGYFSVFKRGMRGTYQHCAEKHLHRYLAEFDFRHNNRLRLGIDDKTRADNLICGIVGKRLTYETTRARG